MFWLNSQLSGHIQSSYTCSTISTQFMWASSWPCLLGLMICFDRNTADDDLDKSNHYRTFYVSLGDSDTKCLESSDGSKLPRSSDCRDQTQSTQWAPLPSHSRGCTVEINSTCHCCWILLPLGLSSGSLSSAALRLTRQVHWSIIGIITLFTC